MKTNRTKRGKSRPAGVGEGLEARTRKINRNNLDENAITEL